MMTFELNKDNKAPVGHKKTTVHMVLDVKIILVRNAQLVANGHKVPKIGKECTCLQFRLAIPCDHSFL